MIYRIEILRSAGKFLVSVPDKQRLSIVRTIDQLRDKPRPPGCRKLRGAELWRIRVERYRIIYTINDSEYLIRIVKIASRREDTYRKL